MFVAGPPRGGTSLVEQILSSHPEVEGIGESELLAQQLQRLPDDRRHHPASLADALSRTGARSVADAYLRQVRALCPDARRIVDKGYSVSLHLGFAALLFPGATLIEVRRDPLDTGWSLFGERFAPGLLPFAYDLGHIGAFLREYERLMRHWRGLLGERLLSVDYAALVSDPAPCVARMLEHCGLPWHEDCLHFERTRRNVFTASAWQVRKPLYGHSVGRARRFRPWLAELRAALDSPAGD